MTLAVLFLLTTGAFGVMSLADGSTAAIDEADLLVEEIASEKAPIETGGEIYPVFAKLDDRNVVLPVAAGDATIIAYSPTSNEAAVPLTPLGSQVNSDVVSRGIERVLSGESSVRYYMLESDSRTVCDTGAVSIGAPAGAAIMSPVSGTVTRVQTYMLYGKYEDVQVDIRPEGLGDLKVSLLLVDEPAVNIGDTVVAGKTQIGKVREVQGDLGERLAKHTRDSGSYVHLEVTGDQAQ